VWIETKTSIRLQPTYRPVGYVYQTPRFLSSLLASLLASQQHFSRTCAQANDCGTQPTREGLSGIHTGGRERGGLGASVWRQSASARAVLQEEARTTGRAGQAGT
jgi:hypothetical protein